MKAENGAIAVFCYGSNGIQQMRERCENEKLIANRAHLPEYARVFAGNSSRWKGAVSSIIPLAGTTVFGSVVMVNEEELDKLDPYEGVDSRDPTSKRGVYRREQVEVEVDDGTLPCIVYIKNQLHWQGPPSDGYLRACKKNIEQYWSEDGNVAVTVRRGDGTIVSESDRLGAAEDIQRGSSSSSNMPEDSQGYAVNVRAIFAYGTLRADFSKDGDRWGVCNIGGGCKWAHGEVRGFSLYQDPDLFYPFAVFSRDQIKGASEVMHGTLLTWPEDEKAWQEALTQCDSIEGYQPDGDGLYKRSIVTVKVNSSSYQSHAQHGQEESGSGSSVASTVHAYIYHQDTHQKDLSLCTSFPTGDWLAEGNPRKKTQEIEAWSFI